MSRHDFFPDEDTTLSAYTHEAAMAAVMFTIGDSEVRFEADVDVLAGLFAKALDELDKGQGVTANGRNPDAQDPRLAAIADHTQKAMDMLEQAIAALDDGPKEELRTPVVMEIGGWFRVPPMQRWHKITGITFAPANGIATLFYDGDRQRPMFLDTTYPYMTDEAFQASCDKADR